MGVIYITRIQAHPTDPNKIRVTFSEAFNTAQAQVAGNYSLSPSVTVHYAGIVSGSGNTQVDLHLGTELATDAPVINFWKMADTVPFGPLTDSGSLNIPLNDNGANAVIHEENGLFGRSRFFNGTNAAYVSAAGILTPRPHLLGEWTLDVMVRPDNSTNNGVIIAYIGTNALSQPENALMHLELLAGTIPVMTWKTGAGVQTAYFSTNHALARNLLHMLTVRKRAVGSLYTVDFFIDGRPADSSNNTGTTNPTANADGGNGANMRYGLAAQPNVGPPWYRGSLDQVRISNVARTDTEILTYTNESMFPLTRGQAYSLQVINVQDAATNTPITVSNGQAAFNYQGLGGQISEPLVAGLVVPQIRSLNGEIIRYGAVVAPPTQDIFFTTGVAPGNGFVNLTLNKDVEPLTLSAANPANWVFSTLSGFPITATSVSIVAANTIRVNFTEGKAGALYTLTLPPNGIHSTDGFIYDGDGEVSFNAIATAPFVALAGAEDGTHVKVIFSEPVVVSEALVPGNYSITGGAGLTVSAVVQETDHVYKLTTSQQVPGQSYTVTVSNIHDLHGNLI